MELLGRACDQAFWKQVREKECYAAFRDDVLKNWQECCEGKGVPELRYRDFIQFALTGSRTEYEDVYFERRRQLDSAAFLSLMYPEEPKYLTYLSDVIFAICNEFSWCLPAHYGPIDKDNSCMIDLFAAETGLALSEVYVMLQDRLDPLIGICVKNEVERRIIQPFCSGKRYWWESATYNWAAVCGGSVGCTIMHLRPDLMDEMRPRLDAIMETYLSGMADDGICKEGVIYWHYGFGHFILYADMLKTFTDGAVDYFSRPKVRAIATYVQKMFLSGKSCVSFADAATTMHYHLGIMHYLKSVYPDDVEVYERSYSYLYDARGRLALHLRTLLWYDKKLETTDHPGELTCYAEDAQWFIRRTDKYGFAAKGGHNDEPHNHNDIGAFIFARDGVQIVTDPGKAKYVRQYFGPDRYTFFHSSSLGHSLPIIGGQGQKFGRQYRARDCRVEDGAFVLDIAGAYGMDALTSLTRRFTFAKNGVSVTDCFIYEGDGVICERIVCAMLPEQLEVGVVAIGESRLTYDADAAATVEVSKHTFDGSTDCYTLDVTLKSDVRSFTYSIE